MESSRNEHVFALCLLTTRDRSSEIMRYLKWAAAGQIENRLPSLHAQPLALGRWLDNVHHPVYLMFTGRALFIWPYLRSHL